MAYEPSGLSGAYPGFCSMKQLAWILLLPPLDGMLVHYMVIPSIKFFSSHLPTWVKRILKCLAQEHNSVLYQGLNPDHSILGQVHQPWGPCASMGWQHGASKFRVLPKFWSRRRMKLSSRQSNVTRRFSAFHAPLTRWWGGYGWGDGTLP